MYPNIFLDSSMVKIQNSNSSANFFSTDSCDCLSSPNAIGYVYRPEWIFDEGGEIVTVLIQKEPLFDFIELDGSNPSLHSIRYNGRTFMFVCDLSAFLNILWISPYPSPYPPTNQYQPTPRVVYPSSNYLHGNPGFYYAYKIQHIQGHRQLYIILLLIIYIILHICILIIVLHQ